jgi:hypothetical protein
LSLVQDASQPSGIYIYTNTITPAGALGAHSLPVSAADSASANASAAISVTIAPASQVWNGNVNGNWNTSDANWQGSLTYQQGDLVKFDDTLTGTTNVVLSTALTPGSVTVNNTVSNYLFSGAGSIGGSTALNKWVREP